MSLALSANARFFWLYEMDGKALHSGHMYNVPCRAWQNALEILAMGRPVFKCGKSALTASTSRKTYPPRIQINCSHRINPILPSSKVTFATRTQYTVDAKGMRCTSSKGPTPSPVALHAKDLCSRVPADFWIRVVGNRLHLSEGKKSSIH